MNLTVTCYVLENFMRGSSSTYFHDETQRSCVSPLGVCVAMYACYLALVGRQANETWINTTTTTTTTTMWK